MEKHSVRLEAVSDGHNKAIPCRSQSPTYFIGYDEYLLAAMSF